ncbi:hypothetical protein BGZ65_009849, partial [Modicella reniformis]
PNIRNGLQDVVRRASQRKRIRQRAITLYMERISDTVVDENDRKVLDKLCPRVSDKDVPDEEDAERVR